MNSPPKDNKIYSKQDYWTARFNREVTYEWLVDYGQIKDIINLHVDKNSAVLILGCGNSLLGQDMIRDGFKLIYSLDYCENVVTMMSNHCDYCQQIDWMTCDAQYLPFKGAHFDCIIEKATLDTFVVKEKSPWTLSPSTSSLIDKVLGEVSRVLTENGLFISISFSQPIHRAPLYSCPSYGWNIESISEIGHEFHHHLYVVRKGLPSDQAVRVPSYEPPIVTKSMGKPSEMGSDDEMENDIFAMNI